MEVSYEKSKAGMTIEINIMPLTKFFHKHRTLPPVYVNPDI